MYMPILEEKLNSNAVGVESFVSAGEKIPLVPVIGSHGEIAFCVQGSVPSVGAISESNLAALQLNLSQNDFFHDKRLMQQKCPGNILLPQLQNSNLTNSNNLMQSVDLASGSGSLSAAIFQSNHLQHFGKPLMFTNLRTSSEANKTYNQTVRELNSFDPLSGKPATYGKSTDIVKSSGDINMNRPSSAGIMTFQNLSKSLLSEERSFNFKSHVTMDEFGPVEKAVFNQAMSTQLMQRINNSKMEITSLTTQKTQSDLNAEGGKHSRRMFERQTGGGGNTCGGSYNQNSTSSITLPLNENPNNAKNLISFNSASAKTNSETLAVRKSLKTAPTPAIRYHPYFKKNIQSNEEKNEAKKLKDSFNQSEEPRASSDFVDSSETAGLFTQVTSGLSSHKTSSVFSVSVPRTGSYMLNNPIESTKVKHVTTSQEPEANAVNLKQAEMCEQKINDEKLSSLDGDDEKDSEKSESVEESKDLLQEKSPSEDEIQETAEPTKKADPSPLSPAPSPPAVREVHLPNPLPSYITKVDKPPARVLKESLHCTTCDVYVNSENQMKQHVNSLRHKNTLQGIPTPPKPGREEKPKVKSDQYRCHVCKVTLNSDIQLSQHLASQRHKNMLEGKPPKPRWSPYERSQQTLLHSASALRLPFKAVSPQSLLTTPQPPTGVVTSSVQTGLPNINGMSTLHPGYLNSAGTLPAPAQLKQTSIMLHEGGLLQAREIVYLGAPQVPGLQQAAAFTTALPTAMPGVLTGQQPVQLQPLIAHQSAGVDWITAGGLRLAT